MACLIGESYTLEGVFRTYIGKKGNYSTNITTFPTGNQLIIGTDFNPQEDENIQSPGKIKIYINDEDYPDFANILIRGNRAIRVYILPVFMYDYIQSTVVPRHYEKTIEIRADGARVETSAQYFPYKKLTIGGIQAALQKTDEELKKKLGLWIYEKENKIRENLSPSYDSDFFKKPKREISIKLGVDYGYAILLSGYIKAVLESFEINKEDLNIFGHCFDVGDNYIYFPKYVKYSSKSGQTYISREENKDSIPINPMYDYYNLIKETEVKTEVFMEYLNYTILKKRNIINHYDIPYTFKYAALYGIRGSAVNQIVIYDSIYKSSSYEYITNNRNFIKTYKNGINIYIPNFETIENSMNVIKVNLGELLNKLSGYTSTPPVSTVYIPMFPASSHIPYVDLILTSIYNLIDEIDAAGTNIYSLPENYVVIQGRSIFPVKSLVSNALEASAEIFYIFPTSIATITTMTTVKNYLVYVDAKNNILNIGTQTNAIRQGLDGVIDYQSGITPSTGLETTEFIPIQPKKRVEYIGIEEESNINQIISVSIDNIYFYSEGDFLYYAKKISNVAAGERVSISGDIADFKIPDFINIITQVAFDYLSGTYSISGIKTARFNVIPANAY